MCEREMRRATTSDRMVLTREAQADGMDPISLEPYNWRQGAVLLSDSTDLMSSYHLIVSLDTYRRMLEASAQRPMLNPLKQGVRITSAHALDGHGRLLFALPLQPRDLTNAVRHQIVGYLDDMRNEPEGAYALDTPAEAGAKRRRVSGPVDDWLQNQREDTAEIEEQDPPRFRPAMARPPSADEDDEPVLARQPANEIEAERQRVLALELDDIPREQVSDYDAYSRLNILQSYAADPRAFDEYYRMVAERIGDERGLGVVARLFAQVAPRPSSPQPSELEAERQRVLELDLASIPRDQIGDYDAFDQLDMLQIEERRVGKECRL